MKELTVELLKELSTEVSVKVATMVQDKGLDPDNINSVVIAALPALLASSIASTADCRSKELAKALKEATDAQLVNAIECYNSIVSKILE